MRRRRGGRLRILSLSAEPPRPGSAARTHLSAIRDALRREGHEVTVLWRDPGGHKVLRLLLFQFTGLARVARCDVVYMRWHVLDLVHVVMARVLGRVLVLEVNGTSDDLLNENPALGRLRWLVRWLSRATLSLGHHVVVVSPGLVDWVRGQAADVPVTFLPNGADARLATASRPCADSPYAVFVGELARHQGIPTLLEARAHADWPASLPLVVVGGGALEGVVADAADGRALVHRGRLGQREAHDILARAAVSISPQSGRVARNRLGVTPLKVAESMMLGTPVVGSRLPGLTEVIERSGSGAVVEPDDPAALARAVAEAWRLDETGREELRRYAAENVSWEAVGRVTARICEEAADRGRSVADR